MFVSIKFWRRGAPPGRKEKAISAERGNGQPTLVQQPEISPLVQASAPRTVRGRATMLWLRKASATLGKPLTRESLFHPHKHL